MKKISGVIGVMLGFLLVMGMTSFAQELKKNAAPKIMIDSPAENMVTYEEDIPFRGSIRNASEFFINNKAVKLDKFGHFSETVSLSVLGPNTIRCYALGKNNETESVQRTVVRASEASESIDTALKSTMLESLSKKVTLELADADIKEVFKILSKKSGLNIVSDASLNGSVNIFLKDTAIKDVIEFILGTQGLSYKMVGNTILIASSSKLDSPVQLGTRIIKLNNLKAQELAAIIKQRLAKSESIDTIEQDNVVVINADISKLETLISIIKQLDSRPVPQVYLEVQVIETSTSALENKGITWPKEIGVGVDASISNQQTVIQSNPSFKSIINLLESEGKAKILARPRLKTINEEEAEIFIGEHTPIVQTTVDTTGRISESVTFVDSGINLKVLPLINLQTGEIRLKIKPEVSIVSGFTGTNNDKPIIKTRKVNTNVWVKDGETVIIGGLFNSTDASSQSKLPLLGDVPLLGNLFSSKSNGRDHTELIISVTPKIVGRTDK